MDSSDLSLLYLACDATCNTIFMAASVPDRGSLAIVGGEGMPWTSLSDENGQAFTFITGADRKQLIAARQNEIVAIDLQKSQYRVLYKHSQKVFYPSLQGESLFFSEASQSAQGAVNPNQGRRLYRYQLAAKRLERALAPWVAYTIGTPFLTGGGKLCLSMVLAHRENDPAPVASAFQGRSSFCLPVANLFGAQADESLVRGALLPGQPGTLEQLVVDGDGRYASGYTYALVPSAWAIYDLNTQKLLQRIRSTGKNMVSLSLNGQRYVHAEVRNGRMTGTIHQTLSGATLSQFTLDANRIPHITIKQVK